METQTILRLPRLRNILPPPRPLPYKASHEVLWKEIEFFLPNTKTTRRLKGRVVRSLENGWYIWTGEAVVELGLHFRKQEITTVEHLLFAKPDDKAPAALGKKCLAYLDAELAKYGLRIGQAIPPNNYD